MSRRAHGKAALNMIFHRPDNPHGCDGACWHCGRRLNFDERTPGAGAGAWHADHWPVPYRDLKDQVMLGVTDERDLTNLVPSCIRCNCSRRHEHQKWYCFGRAQFPVTAWTLNVCLALVVAAAMMPAQV